MEQTQEQPAPAGSETSVEDRFAGHLFSGEEAEQEHEEEAAPSEAVEEGQLATEVQQPAALEEVEWEGVKLGAYPKEQAEKVKSALMAQSDYTVKTQEVAEQRRLIDLRTQTLQQQAAFQHAVSQELNTIAQLDWQIAQFARVDWQNLDTDQYIKTKHQLDALKEQRAGVQQSVEVKREEFKGKLGQLSTELQTKGNEFLKKKIPNWGPDVQKALTAFGKNEGYSDVELGSLNEPRYVHTLWKAMQWDALQSQKAPAKQKVLNAPPVLKPGASSQSTAKANDEAAYRKSLREAKTPQERTRIVQQRFAKKLF